MHEHDLDLIAALADGSLEDEAEARALVQSCDECHAEYAEQRAILELIAGASTQRMTELERAALHRNLWAELERTPTHRGSPWWYRWSYAAAGLFVLLGLVAVLRGGLPFGAGQEVSETFSEIGSGLDAGDAGNVPLQGAPADDGGGDESESTTTAAASETLDYPFAELAEEARARRSTADVAEDGAVRSTATEECLEELGLADQKVIDEVELDRRFLLLAPEGEAPDAPITFVAVDGCEVVYVDG